MRIAQEEIFGPVLSIIEVGSLEEAVQVNNESAYGLSSSIFTENVSAAFTAMRDLASGIVYVNHGTTGAEIQFPFGGVRAARATVIVKRGKRHWKCSPSGNQFTLIIRVGYNGRRLTPTRSWEALRKR